MTDPGQPIHDVSLLLSGAKQHLACGADIDELLEQAADGNAAQFTSHQRDCLYCQAALGEFARVWAPVRSLAAEQVAVPAALKSAVASQIRKLVADVWYTLQLDDGGAIRVAARVVARIAREAASGSPASGSPSAGAPTAGWPAWPSGPPWGTGTPTRPSASSAAPRWSISPSRSSTETSWTRSPARSSGGPSRSCAAGSACRTSP